MGGLGNHKLFSYANIGTKKLIEQYVEEVVFQLNYICDMDVHGVALKDKISCVFCPMVGNDCFIVIRLTYFVVPVQYLPQSAVFFNETRHSFGRSALLLSGGGALGEFSSAYCLRAGLEDTSLTMLIRFICRNVP